jgi:hypothetical protein
MKMKLIFFIFLLQVLAITSTPKPPCIVLTPRSSPEPDYVDRLLLSDLRNRKSKILHTDIIEDLAREKIIKKLVNVVKNHKNSSYLIPIQRPQSSPVFYDIEPLYLKECMMKAIRLSEKHN